MTMKENNFNFSITLDKIKGGKGKPVYISLIRPSSNVKCACTPLTISNNFDSQYGERTLYFAYCPIHHVNTWGYSASEEAIKAWEEGQVTNEKKMVEEMW